MAWQRRLSTDEQNQLLLDYARNVPVADIATKYGVHHSYAALLARRRGQPTRTKKSNVRYPKESSSVETRNEVRSIDGHEDRP